MLLRIDTRSGTKVQLIDERIVATKSSDNPRGQIEVLPQLVQQLIVEQLSGDRTRITQVQVYISGGKYMTLRAGIAFAKGLAKALGTKVSGLDSSEKIVALTPQYDSPPNVIANIPSPIVELANHSQLNPEVTPELNIEKNKYTFSLEPATLNDLEFLTQIEQLLFSSEAWNTLSIKHLLKSDNYAYYTIWATNSTQHSNQSNYQQNNKSSNQSNDSNPLKIGAVCISTHNADTIDISPQKMSQKKPYHSNTNSTSHHQSVHTSSNTYTHSADSQAVSNIAELMSIGIIPQFHRLRAAYFAIRYICQLLQSKGYDELHLEVRESNIQAIGLYNKLGFELLRRRAKYYRNPVENALVMRKVLLDNSNLATTTNTEFSVNATVLGIETTCDETGVGIVQNNVLLADALASSLTQHIEYGGVIPEIAARVHLVVLDSLVDQALEQANMTDFAKVTAIAVAAGPGLLGCLATGIAYAKGLALGLDVPVYGVNHVLGHILAAQLEYSLPQKFLSLIVSGGHTALVLVDGLKFNYIGGTLDDAAGEAFDKVGRLLGLNYPAGPKIDQLAKLGNSEAIKFPLPLIGAKFLPQHKYNFSFSGLKTAAMRELERQRELPEAMRTTQEDFCASFASTVAQILTLKTGWALDEFATDTLVVGGGFSANSQLRNHLQAHCLAVGKTLVAPPIKFCTDNGAMIANLGYQLYRNNQTSSNLNFTPSASLDIESVTV